jgi:hypothetical protein
MDRTRIARRLAIGQGAFFIAAGLWPIVHLRSFEAVTGPKRERWLVKTVGALLAVAGTALAVAGRRRPELETAVLGAGTAIALGAMDVWYAGRRRRISSVYLADAALELGIAGAWAAALPGLLAPPDPEASRAGLG